MTEDRLWEEDWIEEPPKVLSMKAVRAIKARWPKADPRFLDNVAEGYRITLAEKNEWGTFAAIQSDLADLKTQTSLLRRKLENLPPGVAQAFFSAEASQKKEGSRRRAIAELETVEAVISYASGRLPRSSGTRKWWLEEMISDVANEIELWGYPLTRQKDGPLFGCVSYILEACGEKRAALRRTLENYLGGRLTKDPSNI